MFVQSVHQRAAARQDNALIDNVGCQFRRCVFQRNSHAFDNRADGFG